MCCSFRGVVFVGGVAIAVTAAWTGLAVYDQVIVALILCALITAPFPPVFYLSAPLELIERETNAEFMSGAAMFLSCLNAWLIAGLPMVVWRLAQRTRPLESSQVD